MKGINLPIHTSDGDNLPPSIVDELADKIIDRVVNRFLEPDKQKKDGNVKMLGYVIRIQLEKVGHEEPETTTFKLVLKTEGQDAELLNMNLTKSYDLLDEAKFIDGILKDYKSIFMADIPLKRQVKWLGTRKELKYLVCKLSGKDFTELQPKKEGRQRTKGSGRSVLFDETLIFERAANSFLDANGNSFPKKGIQINNAKTPITDVRKRLLDKVAALLIKE